MKTSKSILSPADGRDAETQIFKSKATARKKQEARRSPARKEGPGLTTWIPEWSNVGEERQAARRSGVRARPEDNFWYLHSSLEYHIICQDAPCSRSH